LPSVNRFFNVLLVPQEPKTELPAELQTYPLTTAEFSHLEQGFITFNKRAQEELKEMNENRITNIIDRGGIDGW